MCKLSRKKVVLLREKCFGLNDCLKSRDHRSQPLWRWGGRASLLSPSAAACLWVSLSSVLSSIAKMLGDWLSHCKIFHLFAFTSSRETGGTRPEKLLSQLSIYIEACWLLWTKWLLFLKEKQCDNWVKYSKLKLNIYMLATLRSCQVQYDKCTIYSARNSEELAVVVSCSTVHHPLTFSSSGVSWGWDEVQTTATHQALQAQNVTLTPGDRLCQGWCPGLERRSAKLHNWCRCHSMYGSSAWQCITTTKCDIFQKLSNCSLKSGLDWGPRQRTAAGLSICS